MNGLWRIISNKRGKRRYECKKRRRKRFATALLKAAEDWTKGKGCIGMRLNSGGTRHGAHDFYRAQGYNDEKEQKRFIKMY